MSDSNSKKTIQAIFFCVNLSTKFYPFKPTKVSKVTKNLHIGSPSILKFCPVPPPGCLDQTLPPWPEGELEDHAGGGSSLGSCRGGVGWVMKWWGGVCHIGVGRVMKGWGESCRGGMGHEEVVVGHVGVGHEGVGWVMKGGVGWFMKGWGGS